jgi:hypothetical protein
VCNESQLKTGFKRAPVSAPVGNLRKVSKVCAHVMPCLVEDLVSHGGVRDLLDNSVISIFTCVGELLSRSAGEPFDIGIGPGSVIAAILMASSLLS